jgi:hypothetical protein
MMSYIYQHSRYVMVWLDSPEDESDGAMAYEKFEEASNRRRDAKQAELPFRSLLSKYEPHSYDPLDSNNVRAWEAVDRLFNQDWWTLAWIIQEATCSVPTSLYCGAYGVLLIDTYAALMLLNCI